MTVAQIMWGVLFGSVGMGYFWYGRKQKAMVPLVCGVMLMVFPYFIRNAVALVIICGIIATVPYFFRKRP